MHSTETLYIIACLRLSERNSHMTIVTPQEISMMLTIRGSALARIMKTRIAK